MKDLLSIAQYCYKLQNPYINRKQCPSYRLPPPVWIIPHSYKKILIWPLWINFSITIQVSQGWNVNKYNVITRRNSYQTVVVSSPNLLHFVVLIKATWKFGRFFFLQPLMLFTTRRRNKLWMCISSFTKYGVTVLNCKVINTVNCNWPLLINCICVFRPHNKGEYPFTKIFVLVKGMKECNIFFFLERQSLLV